MVFHSTDITAQFGVVGGHDKLVGVRRGGGPRGYAGDASAVGGRWGGGGEPRAQDGLRGDVMC